MSSYRSDGGRVLTPKEFIPQPQDARSIRAPGRTIIGSTSLPRIPRSLIARPTNTSTKTRGESSVSDSEEHRQEMGQHSKTPNSASGNDSRPSLLPRPIGSFSSSRPQRFPSSTAAPSRTGPSTQSSAVQTTSVTTSTNKLGVSRDRPRNVLRRKAPIIGQQVQRNKNQSGSSSVGPTPSHAQPDLYLDTASKTPELPSQSEDIAPTLPSRLPEPKTRSQEGESSTHRIPKELARLSTALNTHNLPPPAPHFASASSPSTRYSESPGIWSRESTPTSMSSYSPGIVHPTKVGHHLRQRSPIHVRPPMPSRPVAASPQEERIETRGIKSQAPDTTAARSLSSGLTGKAEQAGTAGVGRSGKSPAPPWSPPPRKSSMKFKPPSRKEGDDESKRREEDRKVEEAELRVFDRRSPKETTATPPVPPVTPPSRPSRDGTDKLELEPSPVIRSNLAVLKTTGHKRRESAEKAAGAGGQQPHPVGPAAASVYSTNSKNSRIPSRTVTPSGLPIRSRSTKTPAKETKEKKDTTKETSTRRFGIFSKKSKTEPDGSNSSRADKPTRKGPAAGTGHEGYRKYAHRGRRTSISSNSGVRGRSTSTTRSTSRSISSSKSGGNGRQEQDMDDFLLDRLEPVIIPGGGMDGVELIRTQSEQSVSGVSVASASNLTGHTKGPHQAGYSTDSLVSSAGRVGQSAESAPSERDRPLATQVEGQKREPILVNRRSFYSPRSLPAKDAMKSTTSVNTEPATSPPSGQDYSSSLTALSRTDSAVSASKDERALRDGNTTKGLPKQEKGSKWNFFQRSRDTERKEPTPAPTTAPTPELHATISVVPGSRQVAHYALIDAESDSLEDILRYIEESPPTEEEQMVSPEDIPAGLKIKKQHGQSILLPPPPDLQAEFGKERRQSPKVFFNKEPSTAQQEEKNQAPRPRLASVGRIPRVVSRLDREHRPAQQSFSRPFTRDEAPSLTSTADSERVQQYTSSGPPLALQTDVLPSRPFQSEPDTKPFSAPAPGDVFNFPTGPYSNDEFLRFSPVKEAEVPGPSSSEGKLGPAAATAVNPEPGSQPADDEFWDEYNDLIDDLSPETANAQFPWESSTGERFRLATMASKTLQAELNAHTDTTAMPSPTESTSKTVVPASARSSDSSVRLRRSRIAPALHSSITLTTQVSCSEPNADHGDKSKESKDFEQLDSPSISTGAGDHLVVPRSPSPLASTSFEASRRRNTMMFDIAERDRNGATAQTNLRSGSLMTSRWLSFGRVLFSPAHNRVNSGDQERILVIDGLGNDDWSFYCALTYPNAIVHNLSVGTFPAESTHPDAWKPPDNCHITHHPSSESPFPYPKGFFTVCILRFPAACSEAGQSNIISECKRVLRPGGYLEMSILDVDLVGMGNRTRKAVRMLKERIYLADPNISLKPASDSIQRLLGKYGFDNLHRCMVRLPVAGTIVGSSDSSSSNPSNSAATGNHSPQMSRTEQKTQRRPPSDDGNLSLGDLLSDSPSSSNDESIARIVTKVGRWWYTRCYEIPVLPDGDLDRSIWADKKLLRECQKRGTGFRLLIAYAQKPSEMRRTASV